MKFIRIAITLLLAVWIGAACAALPAAPAENIPTPPVPVVSQAPASPASTPISPTDQAQTDPTDQVVKVLASQLKMDPSAIPAGRKELANWPDACLGLPHTGEVCAQSLTPGYRFTFKVGSQTYVFRTNRTGDIVRQEPEAQSPTNQAVSGAAQKAMQALAQQLGIPQDQIKLISSEEVEWPDSCLGVHKPGIMCAQMVTPGYRVTLEAGGKTYEYHTNLTGEMAIPAQNLAPASDQPVLSWELQGETCQSAQITLAGFSYGFCKGDQKRSGFTNAIRTPELQNLVQTYQTFTADTKAGKVTFTGRGQQVATAAEQRSIAEWARLVVFEASGKAGPSQDLAISWHREGGIAGFCDTLDVYLTGFAYASSCKVSPSSQTAQPNPPAFKRLDPVQMDQLYAWVDSLKSFQAGQKDPAAAADAMSVSVTFTGLGGKGASQQDQQAIQALAETLYTSIRTPSK